MGGRSTPIGFWTPARNTEERAESRMTALLNGREQSDQIQNGNSTPPSPPEIPDQVREGE